MISSTILRGSRSRNVFVTFKSQSSRLVLRKKKRIFTPARYGGKIWCVVCSSGYFCLLIAFLQWQQFTATLHFPVKLVYPTKCALTNDLIIFNVIFGRGSKVIPDSFVLRYFALWLVKKALCMLITNQTVYEKPIVTWRPELIPSRMRDDGRLIFRLITDCKLLTYICLLSSWEHEGIWSLLLHFLRHDKCDSVQSSHHYRPGDSGSHKNLEPGFEWLRQPAGESLHLVKTSGKHLQKNSTKTKQKKRNNL